MSWLQGRLRPSLERLVRWLARLSRVRLPPSAQRGLLLAAATVFVAGGVAAVAALDLDARDVRWWPIAVAALVGVPVNAVLTAAEYGVSARILAHRIGLLTALRVSVVATAANLLPLPGAAVVRVQALRAMGSGYGQAASATTLVGMVWLGLAATLAAAFLVTGGGLPGGLLLLALGVAGLAAGLVLLRMAVPDPRRRLTLGAAVVAVEAASILTGAVRVGLVLLGLGFRTTPAQVIVLTLSGVLASSVGIFPGGLGLREVIAAALSPLVGLPAAAGFLAAGVNRVLGILLHAPITAALAVPRRAPLDGHTPDAAAAAPPPVRRP